jgi:hypothetical protein
MRKQKAESSENPRVKEAGGRDRVQEAGLRVQVLPRSRDLIS